MKQIWHNCAIFISRYVTFIARCVFNLFHLLPYWRRKRVEQLIMSFLNTLKPMFSSYPNVLGSQPILKLQCTMHWGQLTLVLKCMDVIFIFVRLWKDVAHKHIVNTRFVNFLDFFDFSVNMLTFYRFCGCFFVSLMYFNYIFVYFCVFTILIGFYRFYRF